MSKPFHLGYRPALDGLRALAILLVLLGHSYIGPFAGGGGLGVDVFFVLSGFLITSLLYQERQRRGEIRLGKFYLRRVLRLFPALFVALAAWAAWSLVQGKGGRHVGLLSALILGYVSNLASAFGYGFHSMYDFSHAWSLSLEEQFYLLWPGLLWLALRSGLRPARLAGMLLALAVAAFALAAYLWTPGGGWVRVYFAPDTHSGPILAGCTAALLLHARKEPWAGVRYPSLVAALAGAGLLWAVLRCHHAERSYYYLALPLVTVATIALLLVTLDDRHGLTRLLSLTPLVWLGRLSYSLYLWHVLAYDMVRVLSAGHPLRWSAVKLLSNAVALALACLSYYLVEKPFLRLKDRV